MAKDTYYFSHDYNARNDEKILELRSEFGAEGYGVFWMIVETMAENENGSIKASLIGGLSLAFGVTKESIKNIIDYCISIELFYNDNGFIFSKRLKKHKQFRTKLIEDGKKGAEKRWKNSPPKSTPNAKERKEKEIPIESIKADAEPIGISLVKETANKVWKDVAWIESLCMGNGLKLNGAKDWMQQFNLSISQDIVEGFNEAKYKKMFSGWLRMKLGGGQKIVKMADKDAEDKKHLKSIGL